MTPNLLNGEVAKGQTATAARPDMSETLRRMHTRSPQELLGVNNDGALLRSSILATILIAALLGGWTAAAYVFDKPEPSAAKAGKSNSTEPSDAAAQAPPAKDVAAKTDPKKGDEPKGKETAKTPPKKDLMDVLGESGTKKADPKLNPLDIKNDDLFKDSK